jgi:catechol 2,3-dioxygenase-like lactoylglutathione lyase family enzyme
VVRRRSLREGGDVNIHVDGAFSGFSVNHVEKAKAFYRDVVGMEVHDQMGGLSLSIGGDKHVFVYPKDDHVPATYTCLNFPVDDIDAAVDVLAGKGVAFLQYEGITDDKGIARGKESGLGPDIAWFIDPAGNILSLVNG